MNSASEKRLAKVHPVLAERVTELARSLASKGVTIECVQGLRTFAEQDALYAQGRTKPGQRVTNARGGASNHNYGLAVDVCPFKDGKPDWNDWAGFGAIGTEARKLGLEWGGDWKKLVDKPHVQLPSAAVKTLRKLYDKGGLPEVWKSVQGIAPKIDENPDEDIFEPIASNAFAATVEPISAEDAAKGVTSGSTSDSSSAGPQPPADAVEVKASRPTLKSVLTTVFLFIMGPLSYVGIDMQTAARYGLEFAKNNFVMALKVAVGFGLVVLAIWFWKSAMANANMRTLKLMDMAGDKFKNNVRLVGGADPKPTPYQPGDWAKDAETVEAA